MSNTSIFTCEICQKGFSQKYNLNRHLKNCGQLQKTFNCGYCSKIFKRGDNLDRHFKNCHKEEGCYLTCCKCMSKFIKYHIYQEHILTCSCPSASVQTFICRACNTTLPNTKALTTHTKIKHLKPPSATSKQSGDVRQQTDSEKHDTGEGGSSGQKKMELGKYVSANNKSPVKPSNSSNLMQSKDSPTQATHLKGCPPASQQISSTHVFTCEFCNAMFRYKRSLNRHIKNCGPFKKNFTCDICSKVFTRKDNLDKHILEYHTNDASNFTCLACRTKLPDFTSFRKHIAHCKSQHLQPYPCLECQKAFPSNQKLVDHIRAKHSRKRPSTSQQKGGGKRAKTRADSNGNGCSRQAINGQVREWEYVPENNDGTDFMFFSVKIQSKILEVLKSELEQKRSIKWSLCTQIEFSKTSTDGQKTLVAPYFRTKMTSTTQSSDVEEMYTGAMQKILKDMDNYQGESSNLNFEKVLRVQLSVVKHKPFRGSSYLDLPDKLSKKKCILNVRNLDDDLCFVYSILAQLCPVPNERVKEQVAEYTLHLGQLELDGFDFPMSLKDIKRFEQTNQLCINVYGYEDETVFPLHVSDNTQVPSDRQVDLLLITEEVEEEDEPPISHYCLITSLSALVKNNSYSRHVCRKCLWCYSSAERLENHKPYCYHKAQTIKMPKPDKAVRHFGLGQMSKTQRVSFVIYADFESVLTPLELSPSDEKGGTRKIQHHEPCGYSYKVVCRVDHLSKPLKVYSGKNAANDFMRNILVDYEECMEKLKYENRAEMVITAEDERKIAVTTECYLCHKPLNDESKVHRDHDHLTGQFRGMCHRECNVNLQEADFVACICHNGTRYDNHLILQAAENFHDRKLTCIPQNTEQFIMFQIDQLRFIDSFKFLSTSLDNLAANLKNKGQDQFVHLAAHFPDHIDMLTRKLPYFYEYVDSFQKLDETDFPSRDQFYSSLSESTVSQEDYDFARQIWDTFECRTISDFMELYVQTDTLILTDVFEQFRTMCLEYYGLDPCHYYTLPGMAMDACLKMTRVRLDLMVDPDQYAFIEKGIRGGVAMIGHRHAVANNKYMSNYDKDKPESYLMYYDVNSLYATCMTEPLPCGDFQWIDPNEFRTIDWLSLDSEGERGYILEVDIEYPRELHKSHSTLPVAPTKESIPYEEFSPYHKNLLKELGIKDEKPSGTKLFSTLKNKYNYVIHYETLKFYLHLGLKLMKVHKVLGFKQSKWMKPFIEFNIQKRKEATDNFAKDLFKLISNAAYGKTLQNVRNYQHVVLVMSEGKTRRYCAKTNFKSVKIFLENLVAISLEKVSVTLNQPVSVGFTVLEHAKRIFFSFHYDVMLKEYGDRLKVAMTDTDSLLYHISASSVNSPPLRNPYNFMLSNLSLFDTSNYSPTRQLYSKVNHKVLGVMKDEEGGHVIVEFVGLRAKNYSYLTEENLQVTKESKRLKGIQRNFVKKHIHHDMFKECLYNHEQSMASFNQIRSDHNELFTVRVNKFALIPFDNKRFLLEDGVKSVPYGYNPLT